MKRSLAILGVLVVILLSSCQGVVDEILSSDATLSELTVTEGELSPTFSSATNNYTVSVDYDVDNITINGTTNSLNASISYDPSMPVTLSEGSNSIDTIVTAEDGVTTNTYSIVVNKETAPIIPKILPSIGSPSVVSRSFMPNWDNYVYDLYVPAINGFTNNLENISVEESFTVMWGNLSLDFVISEDDGVYTYIAELDDSYMFKVVHNTNNDTFEYRHELNITGPEPESENPSDIVAICTIPESSLADDYSFNTTSSVVAYTLNEESSPGMLYYFDQVAVYSGEMQANPRLGLEANQNGYGFAFHTVYIDSPITELSLSLNDTTTITTLNEILDGTNDFKATGSSINGACLGVTLDDGSEFWEHNMGFDENDIPAWCDAFDDDGVYVGTDNGTIGSRASLEQFKTFIPWSTTLSE